MSRPLPPLGELAHGAVEIRVRGRVQGVGFRPLVWRHARELGLGGSVSNFSGGVLIRAAGPGSSIAELIARIGAEPPPLASVEGIECTPCAGDLPAVFEITSSKRDNCDTEIAPDAVICVKCAEDVLDPFSRRYRYPFTTCTDCGPRLSVIRGVPYDRATTSMAAFDLCPTCAAEYADPADRRFHAETTACHACGPRVRLIRFDGRAVSFDQTSMLDDVDGALGLIQKGEIVAIKGLGGYQLACDATRADSVARLRAAKHRDRKPFALMARDLDIIRRYCNVSPAEEAALTSPAAPIVLLEANGAQRLPAAIAPGLDTFGFMLPTTPLHVLLLRRMSRPVVMTSGNRSSEPQITDDGEARERLVAIAPFALVHDRDIVNRVDDSVVRVVACEARVMRRSRGFAPAPVCLPAGFADAPPVLAAGGDLKSAFCMVRNGQAVLSQHIGDLDEPGTLCDFERMQRLYRQMLDFTPTAIARDLHPGYRSCRIAARIAEQEGVQLLDIQHHHAHVASCLAENGRELNAPRILGIALDGLGFGEHGEIWGGEFLLADYREFQRLGTFKPVAMPGGDRASREPWRNLYAHLMAEMGWTAFHMNFAELAVHGALAAKPRAVIDAMLRERVNAPLASSCGRLFDAAAAAMGLCFEEQAYEGEAAALLEAAVDRVALTVEDENLSYPFTIPRLEGSGLPYIEPLAVWNAILGDLILGASVGVMAARFHRGLARAIATMAAKLAARDSECGPRFDTVALTGGCFNNRILLECVADRLDAAGFRVLTHRHVPSGDGGLALGQAAVASAQLIATKTRTTGGTPQCVSASLDGS